MNSSTVARDKLSQSHQAVLRRCATPEALASMKNEYQRMAKSWSNGRTKGVGKGKGRK